MVRCDSWGSIPHLMHSGDAVHIMAMWCVLIGGVNAPCVCLFGFLADFQFFVLVFRPHLISFLFFLHFPFLSPLLLCASSSLSCSPCDFFALFLSVAAFLLFRYVFFFPSLLLVE